MACVSDTCPEWIDGMAQYNLVSDVVPDGTKTPKRNPRVRPLSAVKQGHSRLAPQRFAYYCRFCTYQTTAQYEQFLEHVRSCEKQQTKAGTAVGLDINDGTEEESKAEPDAEPDASDLDLDPYGPTASDHEPCSPGPDESSPALEDDASSDIWTRTDTPFDLDALFGDDPSQPAGIHQGPHETDTGKALQQEQNSSASESHEQPVSAGLALFPTRAPQFLPSSLPEKGVCEICGDHVTYTSSRAHLGMKHPYHPIRRRQVVNLNLRCSFPGCSHSKFTTFYGCRNHIRQTSELSLTNSSRYMIIF